MIKQVSFNISQPFDLDTDACQNNLFKQYFESKTTINNIRNRSEQNYQRLLEFNMSCLKQLGESASSVCIKPCDNWRDEGGYALVAVNTDCTYLVDSLNLYLTSHDIVVDIAHYITLPIMHKGLSGVQQKSLVYLELNNKLTASQIDDIETDLEDIFTKVQRIGQDNRVAIEQLNTLSKDVKERFDDDNSQEISAFLTWAMDHHFLVFGCMNFKCATGDEPYSSLGVQFGSSEGTDYLAMSRAPSFPDNTPVTGCSVTFHQLDEYSCIHRYDLLQQFVISQWHEGKLQECTVVCGMFSLRVSTSSVVQLPTIRRKIQAVFDGATLHQNHDSRAIIRFLEAFPRANLLRMPTEDIAILARALLQMQRKDTVHVQLYEESDGCYSCFTVLPKANLRDEFYQRGQQAVCQYFDTDAVTRLVRITDNDLALVVWRISSAKNRPDDISALQQTFERISVPWQIQFKVEVLRQFDGNTLRRVSRFFENHYPSAYQEQTSPIQAAYDLSLLAETQQEQAVSTTHVRLVPWDKQGNNLNIRVLRAGEPIVLSDLIRMIENFGFTTLSERPYVFETKHEQGVWIHSLVVSKQGGEQTSEDQLDHVDTLCSTLEQVLSNALEDDRLNQLSLSAGLNGRQILLLRAYAEYLSQIDFVPTIDQAISILNQYVDIAGACVHLFESLFSTLPHNVDTHAMHKLIKEKCGQAASFSEEKFLLGLLDAITATCRTNYFQYDEHGHYKTYISLKISPSGIYGMPEPVPLLETFVFSASMKAIHIRMSKVARGGIRWSDRSIDVRSEVMDLVRSQRVKNAITVPAGAKGGFIVRKSSEDFHKDGVEAYKTFMRGLLDLADNRIGNEYITPQNVVCRDDNDAYIVVAADKGTAAFSDIANAEATTYGYWLGDAFASGGKDGYDHKKMGITAKGAWVALENHLRNLSIDLNEETIKVVGIGDMSGDVFGNGMLLSKQIQLVAAFNHRHIFIDPAPDAKSSYEERLRLFALPRSSWSDYDHSLLSSGGMIFERKQKYVKTTPEIRTLLDISDEVLQPDELIKHILKAQVDLLWNGGIGTYIKSSHEISADLSDKVNAPLRINGEDLRCKIFCEGGNLGATPKGRIEAALHGVCLNGDFVDNSAGVDCSDHEVNIKIVFASTMQQGLVTLAERNNVLSSFTDEVSELVLANNYSQTFSLGVSTLQMRKKQAFYPHLIKLLQDELALDLNAESLCNKEQYEQRITAEQYLTRPEVAVLNSYCKMLLKQKLSVFSITDLHDFKALVAREYPTGLLNPYGDIIQHNYLSEQIAVTIITNMIVDRLGLLGCYSLLIATDDVTLLNMIKLVLGAFNYCDDVKQWTKAFDRKQQNDEDISDDALIEKQQALMSFVYALVDTKHIDNIVASKTNTQAYFTVFNQALSLVREDNKSWAEETLFARAVNYSLLMWSSDKAENRIKTYECLLSWLGNDHSLSCEHVGLESYAAILLKNKIDTCLRDVVITVADTEQNISESFFAPYEEIKRSVEGIRQAQIHPLAADSLIFNQIKRLRLNPMV